MSAQNRGIVQKRKLFITQEQINARGRRVATAAEQLALLNTIPGQKDATSWTAILAERDEMMRHFDFRRKT